MRIGIFDSGIGGEALKAELEKQLPQIEFMIANDKGNLPYGNKTKDEIARLTDKAIQPLLAHNCHLIVIACNTATVAAIEMLRERYPQQVFIGLEPMIKPAAKATHTGVVAICATPTTLSSARYKYLKKEHAKQINIYEPDCSEWAYMIENSQVQKQQIKQTIDQIKEEGADVIVLGCTHYHWIKSLIKDLSGKEISIIEPTSAILRQISRELESMATES